MVVVFVVVVVVVVVVVEVDVVVAVVVVGVEQFAPHIESSTDNSIGSRNTERQKCSHTFYSVSNEIKVFILYQVIKKKEEFCLLISFRMFVITEE